MPVITPELIRRLDFAGRAHASLSRQRLGAARDAAVAHRPASRSAAVWDGIRSNALRGACIARQAASPLTVGLDAVVSNHRGRQGHFCDVGILPPVLAAVGIIGAAFVVGEVLLAATMMGAGHVSRLLQLSEAAATLLELPAAFAAVFLHFSAMDFCENSLRNTWGWWTGDRGAPSWPQRIYGTVALSTIGVSLYVINQTLGLSTALVKAGITGTGLAFGALAGVAVGLCDAYAYVPQAPDAVAAPQSPVDLAHHAVAQQMLCSINRETLLHACDIETVPDARWFFIPADNGTGHGFDCRELAAWFSMPASRWPWENPYTRIPLNPTQVRALVESDDAETRDNIAVRWPDKPWAGEALPAYGAGLMPGVNGEPQAMRRFTYADAFGVFGPF